MTAIDRLSLGEGSTPVLALTDSGHRSGPSEVWVKAEWLNPTGSYKDRIALETVRHALHSGHRGWVGTSSGNGGAAMAAYGARAGLPGYLCVAADAPAEKLRSIVPYGVTLLPMANLGLAEMDAIGALAAEHRLKLAVTAYRYNPEGMAGAETIGAELLEQGPFTHVYVPTGGGGLLTAVARGLAAGRATGGSGVSGPIPRVVCAQPSGCAPIARFLSGELAEPRVERCTTTVSGLQLPAPPDGSIAAAAVTDSDGWGTAVSDDEAWAAQDLLAERSGIFVEPAAAVAVAAIMADIASGRLGADDRPVAVLTGSGLKDLRRFGPRAVQAPEGLGIDDLCALLAGG